jgi:hypothetical protein
MIEFVAAGAFGSIPLRRTAKLLPPPISVRQVAMMSPLVAEKPQKKTILDLDELQAKLAKKFEPIIKIVNHIDDLEVGNGQYKFVYKTDL